MNIARTVLAAIALAGAGSAPAYAVTITTNFTPGSSATPATVFQSFTTGSPNGTPYVAQPGETVIGVVRTYQTNQAGQAVGPIVTPATGSFLSIINGSYSVALTGAQVFSFVFGGLDTYNAVTLFFQNAGPVTFTGGQILAGNTSASTAVAAGMTGRVTYDFGATDILNSVTFSSPQAAFEIDELASAAPEPAAWALMILGFGIVGSALRRRRRTQVRFNFA